MDHVATELLRSMYSTESQLGAGGALYYLDDITKISREQGEFLYEFHKTNKPVLSVEVGLAYGFSTVWLLSAMKDGDYGHHIAIDPFEDMHWNGIGRTRASLLGMEDRFTFMAEPSLIALPRLIEEKRQAQFIFIDGDHKFDGVFLDFVLSAHLCAEGGHIVLDDMWMPSIRKVVRFIERNRSDFSARPCPINNVSIFEKTGTDTRDWRHFVEF